MYKTNINKINLNSTDFIESIQTNDLIIGEDDSNSLIINSNNKFVNNSTIDGKLNVNNILEKYDGNIINYNITVASKTSAHPYFGQGSSSCYYIDGNESPFIEFVLGKTYRFKQSDTSNSSHPLRFYKQSNKTTQYTTDVTTNGIPGNSGAYTEINITETTLGRLFYMCQAHGYMGNQIQVKGNVNSFQTIVVSGQSDVVADSSTDTLTLVAGSNMTLTTNAGTNTITFASGGSIVGFFVQPASTISGTYGTDGTYGDYSLSGVERHYPLQKWTIKGYGGYYMNNSSPRFGFNSGHFDSTTNSGGKFTAPSTGYYFISYNIDTVDITGSYHTTGIFINGGAANGGTALPNSGSTNGNSGEWTHSKHHFGGVNAEPDDWYDSSNTSVPNSRYHRPQNHTETLMINLQQNDYVQLVVYTRTDTTYTINKESFFCIYKL